ncbi:MAG: hypothetical protein J7496_09005 [Novosphingobium sp.]|nr:hypothetical protein [Novosphingobium sp.]
MNALLNRVFGRTSPSLGEDYPAIKAHVLKRIADTAVGENPFYHLYIESLFPEDFYTAMFDYKQALKVSGQMIARNQDNAAFQNRRYPLADDHTQAVRQFRALWDDFDVRKAVLEKFYIAPNDAFCDSVRIHEKEFEFVFCEEGRFQNIHVDIPQKFLSFVFYFPEIGMDEQDEKANATILYNRELEPVYGARFRANSVCIFAPHFYSYHGFATTRERDVLVMFYTREKNARDWQEVTRNDLDRGPDFKATLDLVEEKLEAFPLIEYGADPARIARERAACRINAPKGRVIK